MQAWSKGGRFRWCKRGLSEGGGTGWCKRGVRTMEPDGASLSEGGGTTQCKRGLRGVEPDGAHWSAGRSLNLGPVECWSLDRDVISMAK